MSENTAPNVIVFLADDLAFGDLGCHGNSVVHTPHIDRFAADSVEFDRFYVSPVCAPTRASLLTGRWNFRTGVTDVFGVGCEMSSDETTLAEDFRAAGYATGLFGKWHLGDKGPHRPTQRGFDETLTFEGPAMFADQYFDPVLLHNDRPEKWSGYCMDVFTDGAIDFIRRHRRERFFLYLPANLIHTPMVAPDSLIAQYDNLGLLDSTKTIYGMIESLDRNFGRLRAALSHLGLEENTIIVVLSDNGPCSGSQPIERHMAGLHGLKGTPYENGVRVPAFIRWPSGGRNPGRLPEGGGGGESTAGLVGGALIAAPAAHVDIRPTLHDLSGVSAVGDRPMDGRSLVPFLREAAAGASAVTPGSARPTARADQTAATVGSDASAPAPERLDDRPIILQWDSGGEPRHGRAFCVIEERWKLVQPCGMDAPNQQHIRDRYAELCRLQGRGDRSIEGPPRYELYDINADPGEWRDVAAKHPDEVARLRRVYDEWFADVAGHRGP